MRISKGLLFSILLFSILSKIKSALMDPYKILGVRKNAPSEEIRRAYKKLARQW